ncbi:MAG: HK97 family phage prohead protease [Faecalibacterium sp.]
MSNLGNQLLQAKKTMSNIGQRDFFSESIRAVDGGEDGRTFELSFSSEEPCQRWYGPEILDHSPSCVDLSRMKQMGVVLYNHDRNKVIGKVTKVWLDGKRGKATIAFDSDAESENIRQKVASGTLKGVSVGYQVNNWEVVKEGSKSKDGRFSGPCYIAKKWMPFEISIVSVPADATVGVGRDLYDGAPQPPASSEIRLSYFESCIIANKNNR